MLNILDDVVVRVVNIEPADRTGNFQGAGNDRDIGCLKLLHLQFQVGCFKSQMRAVGLFNRRGLPGRVVLVIWPMVGSVVEHLQQLQVPSFQFQKSKSFAVGWVDLLK
jgi:hypothetical protein